MSVTDTLLSIDRLLSGDVKTDENLSIKTSEEMSNMEEMTARDLLGKDIGDICKEMYLKVDRNNPVMGLINGIRVIMFVEEHVVDPHYDGPR